MKKIILSIVFLTAGLFTAVSQENKTIFTPKQGDVSFGVSFNPVSMSQKGKFQPATGDFSGNFVQGVGSHPHQMYILSMDPVIAFSLKYRVAPSWSLKGKFGFTGSQVNHKEYVQDDVAVFLNSDSQNKVVDVATGNLNAASFGLSFEYNKQFKDLQFNAGVGLLYAIAGGSMDFAYGNKFRKENGWAPSTMPMTAKPTDPKAKSLNEFGDPVLGIDWARPVRRYNTGYTNGIGFTLDMGVEWFFLGRMSIGASLTFTPIMMLFQPQTYTIYEGYSKFADKVMQYNSLVSPGSNGFLYGTDNFGLSLSFNYYL